MPFTIKKTTSKEHFENVHKNYKLKYSHKGVLKNKKNIPDLDAYNETTDDIKKLVGFAIDNKIELRPYGSKWSLSQAPYSKDLMFDYSNLKLRRFLKRKEVNVSFKTNKYLFAQSGNLIGELNLHCEKNTRSLQTSGASNGQTIAGAISTGVHGSAYRIGSISDTVVGLHIVVDRDKHVYLEAKSNSVVSKEFISQINATHIQNDAMFHSALVSMGAFGFIHGVMIEVAPLFEIKNYVTNIEKADAYQLSKTLDFKNSNFKIPRERREPYHFKLYFNQYDLDGKNGIKAEVMYARGPRRGFIKNIIDYFKDMPKILGKFTVSANCTIPALAKFFSKFVLPKNGEETGYLNDIFHKTKLRGSVFSTAFAVPMKDSVRTLELMLKVMKDSGRNVPSIFSFRFAQKSKATLAFTKFKMNCIIGLDGLQSNDTDNYLKLMHQALDNSNIPYAFHWGKVTNMNAAMVDRMYGPAKTKWVNQRHKLLSPRARKVFSNNYLRKLGLA